MDPVSKLNEVSNVNRLNTVEAAYAGSAGAQSNFKGKWQGYDEKGNGLVKVNGEIYTANSIGTKSIAQNTNVILRVGKGIKNVNW